MGKTGEVRPGLQLACERPGKRKAVRYRQAGMRIKQQNGGMVTMKQDELHQKAMDKLQMEVFHLRERAVFLDRFLTLLRQHPETTEQDFDMYAKRTGAWENQDYAPTRCAMPFDAIRHWLEYNTYGDDDDEGGTP
jgi:hypothetical protein